MNSGKIEYVNLEELSRGEYKIINGEADISGWPVRDELNNEIGKVRDLLFDPKQNAIRYIIVDINAAATNVEKAILIPIGYANLGSDKKEVILPVMQENQIIAMPQYIIGEVTRDTEMQIRSAIGSSSNLTMDEEIVDIDHDKFYSHHHFDRGNLVATNTLVNEERFENDSSRYEEKATIHQLIKNAEENEATTESVSQNTSGKLEEFNVNLQEGTFAIQPQENGTYRIIDQGNKIGVIYAEASEEGVQWRTMDQLDERFVTAIGEAIKTHHDSTSHL